MDEGQSAARALSSPVRMRILRLCRFEARTNKELADLLGLNPGTVHHHVRTLADAGFLVAEAERAGAQGAREVPYRATGASWNAPMEETIPVMMETVRQQVALAEPQDVLFGWLGLRLSPEHHDELHRRIVDLFAEYKDREPDVDGESFSLVAILHPDLA